jgi:hypothetical protein
MKELALFVVGALLCGWIGWGGCALSRRWQDRADVADLDADGQASERAGTQGWQASDAPDHRGPGWPVNGAPAEDDDPATSQWARDLISDIESWNRMELVATTGRQP